MGAQYFDFLECEIQRRAEHLVEKEKIILEQIAVMTTQTMRITQLENQVENLEAVIKTLEDRYDQWLRGDNY